MMGWWVSFVSCFFFFCFLLLNYCGIYATANRKARGASGFVEIPDAPTLRLVSLTLKAWVAFDAISSGVRGRGTALNPRRPRRAELSLNLVDAPRPCPSALLARRS